MPSENESEFPSPADQAAEARLAGLIPSAGPFDRDRLLFRAGRKAGASEAAVAGRRQLRIWRCAAAVLLVAAGVSLAVRSEPRVVQQIVYQVPKPPSVEDRLVEPIAADVFILGSAPSDAATYLTLRDAVLRDGVDALPVSVSHRSSPARAVRANDRAIDAGL